MGGRRIGAVLAIVLVAAAAASAAAAGQRMTVEAMEYPWSAIGRLNVAGHSYCSAVLVSERHVLTAAHCLWDRVEGRWWPASAIHFVAGYQGGTAVLHTTLVHYAVADHYVFHAKPTADQVDDDWAIGELAQPLGRQAGWIATAPPPVAARAPVGQLGYRAESRHALSLDYGCRVLGHPAARHLFWDDCAAAHGDSGGPVLAFLPDGPHVIGITAVVGQAAGRPITGAVDITALTDAAAAPQAARLAVAAGVGHNPGRPPPAGAPARATPTATVAELGKGEALSPSMAALARLLATAASVP